MIGKSQKCVFYTDVAYSCLLIMPVLLPRNATGQQDYNKTNSLQAYCYLNNVAKYVFTSKGYLGLET